MGNLIKKQIDFESVPFEVDAEKGLINLNTMAKPFGKSPAEWRKLPSAQKFLDAYAKRFQLGENLLVKEGVNGDTWANKHIAIKFAQWLDPEFEVYCTIKLDELFTTGSASIKPLSPTEILIQQSIMLDNLVKQQATIANHLGLQDKRLSALENYLPEVNDGHLTVRAYINKLIKEKRLSRAIEDHEYSCLGKDCTKLSHEMGFPIGKVPDKKHYEVNTYHESILELVFMERCLIDT